MQLTGCDPNLQNKPTLPIKDTYQEFTISKSDSECEDINNRTTFRVKNKGKSDRYQNGYNDSLIKSSQFHRSIAEVDEDGDKRINKS